MKTEHECEQRNNACTAAEQAPDRDRNDQHEEEIEQLPLAHPATARGVHAGRSEQFVAGRQVQYCVDPREARIPPRDGQPAASFRAAERLEIDLALAHLDACLSLTLPPGDQQVLVELGCAQQRVRRPHIEAPVGAHLPANRVPDHEAATVEVEPDRAFEIQFVGRRDNASASLDDFECRTGLHAKCRVVIPVTRHFRLDGIDGWQAFGGRDAQAVI